MSRTKRTWFPSWLVAKRRQPARSTFRPAILRLEDRTVPNGYTVIYTTDTGTGSGSTGDLRYCVGHATSDGDTIGFNNTVHTGWTNFYDGSAHTITLGGSELAISHSITITGAGAGFTIIDANHASRIFDISDAGRSSALAVSVNDLTIKNGSVAGVSGAADADALGGGILFNGGSHSGDTLSISNCTLSGNTALANVDSAGYGGTGAGGALAALNVNVTISSSNVSDNGATGGFTAAQPFIGGPGEGGGLYVVSTNTTGPTKLTVSLSTISGNAATGGGVGVYSPYTVAGLFAEAPNYPKPTAGPGDGGGIFFFSKYGGSTDHTLLFSMTDTEMQTDVAQGGNTTDTIGYGYANGGDGLGGGIDVLTAHADGTLTAEGRVTSSTLAADSANGGSATITNYDISGPTRGATGGSAFAGGASVAELVNSTLSGDIADGGYATDSGAPHGYADGGYGGGGGFGPGEVPGVTGTKTNNGDGYLFNYLPYGTTYTIANTTISGNSAVPGGYRYATGGASYTSSDNAFGGGVDDGLPVIETVGGTQQFEPLDNVGIYSTIVATDYAYPSVADPGNDIVGAFSYGHNLVGETDRSAPNFPASAVLGTPPMPAPNAYSDLVGTVGSGRLDPGFAGVAEVGSTGITFLPLALNSLAIDNGENNGPTVYGGPTLTYDEREYPFLRSVPLTDGTTTMNYSDGTDVGAVESVGGAVYADRQWSTDTFGTVIPDADPITSGNQRAVFGYNAFATITDAIAAAATLFAANPSAGEVIVNGKYSGSGGTFNENVDDDSAVPLIMQAGPMSLYSLTIESTASVEIKAKTVGASGDGFTVSTGTTTHAGVTSYGLLTLDYGASGLGVNTELANTGTLEWEFYNGSKTYISDPLHSSGYLAGFDLNGENAMVTGSSALLVNNGYVADSSSGGTGHVISDTDALVKGAGYWQNSVVTQNGGRFQAGNSPGSDFVGPLVFGYGGVSNYIFAIDDATGTAGPSPDSEGHVDGWSLIHADSFSWAADADHQLNVSLQTLTTATTAGNDVSGSMANFDPTQSYSWAAVTWTGSYSGPTDDADLNAATVFDTSAFQNSFSGTFSWHLDAAAKTLYLTYTPA